MNDIVKNGKRNLILSGIILAMAAQIVFCLIPNNFAVLLITTIIRGIGVSPLFALLFGIVGDAVEYGQWKTHLRQESLMFSAGSVGNKIGIGIVGAVTTGLLSFSGYISSANDASVVQPDSALQMITNLLKFAPMILFAGVIIVMLFYKLDKQYPMIMEELREREKRGEL